MYMYLFVNLFLSLCVHPCRMHTLVLVKDSCELLSFGLGASGQLGSGSSSNLLEPSPIKGDNWTAPVISGRLSDTQLTEGTPVDGRTFKGIFAGGDQSFATIVVSCNSEESMVCKNNCLLVSIFPPSLLPMFPSPPPSLPLFLLPSLLPSLLLSLSPFLPSSLSFPPFPLSPPLHSSPPLSCLH